MHPLYQYNKHSAKFRYTLPPQFQNHFICIDYAFQTGLQLVFSQLSPLAQSYRLEIPGEQFTGGMRGHTGYVHGDADDNCLPYRPLPYRLTPPAYEEFETEFMPPGQAYTRLVRVELRPPPGYTRDPPTEPWQLWLLWEEFLVPLWRDTMVPLTVAFCRDTMVPASYTLWQAALTIATTMIVIGLPPLLASLVRQYE